MRKHLGSCINHSHVVDSRPREGDGTVWRRRRCLKCYRRFTTFEIEGEELERLRRLDIFERKLVAFADELQSADAVSTKFITPEVPANLQKPTRQ